MAYVAFEISALPFLPITEWRVGVLLVGTAVMASGLFVVNPIIAVLFSAAMGPP